MRVNKRTEHTKGPKDEVEYSKLFRLMREDKPKFELDKLRQILRVGLKAIYLQLKSFQAFKDSAYGNNDIANRNKMEMENLDKEMKQLEVTENDNLHGHNNAVTEIDFGVKLLPSFSNHSFPYF